MSKTPVILIKVDPDFKKEIDDIKLERIKKGFDKKMRSDRRITKALRRLSSWEEIKKKIIEAEMEDDIR